ncbi:hypothetical protein KGR00_01935, partial [Halomonas coralii]|nr:hypothetical protein [Modicisalibacter sp. MOD 31.J]
MTSSRLIDTPRDTRAPSTATLPLDVRNLKKRFGDNEVLKGLSLEAHQGDVISLIGASGSG